MRDEPHHVPNSNRCGSPHPPHLRSCARPPFALERIEQVGEQQVVYLWAMLPARLFESLPLVCPHGGADRRIVAFIAEAAPVRRILTHIGEPAEPPRIGPARGPPERDDVPALAVPDWGALAQPQPEYVFDQRVQR